MNDDELLNLIETAVALKEGNREFSLQYIPQDGMIFPAGNWCAEIGNSSMFVRLGEQPGEFYGEGKTPHLALLDLITKLRAAG